MSYNAKSSTHFKKFVPRGFQLKRYRVVLRDILKCRVRLNRLSADDIASVLQNGVVNRINGTQNRNLRPFEVDHNYSRAVPNVIAQPSVNLAPQVRATNKSSLHRFLSKRASVSENESDNESTDDHDEDDNDDTDDQNDYVDGQRVAYPPIVVGAIEQNMQAAAANDVENDNNEDNNGEDAIDSGISEDSSDSSAASNEMDTEDIYSSSPNSDDADEATRFLNDLKKELDATPDPPNRIFGDICPKFLIDECYNTSCELAHSLPEQDVIEQRLKMASFREIIEAQDQFLLEYDPLLGEYFTIFCDYYGQNWKYHRETLRLLIGEISQRTSPTPYLKEIVNSFVSSGIEYSTCVELLLLEFHESLTTEMRFDIIWDIMIDTKNEKVAEQLDEFESILHGDEVDVAMVINKILRHQINDQLMSLQERAISLLKKCTVTAFRKIDQSLLKNYIWHMKGINSAASKAIQQRATQFGMIDAQ